MTIFFSDVVGFTNICAAVTPIEVVRMLNDLYTVMDYCTSLFPLYKVETIGDAYMVVGGLPERCKNHAQQVADFAVLVSKAVQCVKSPVDGTPIRIRIGMHSGSVMAGVVGNLMPRYCLFGDTVNTASRMESNGEAGRIHCSGTVAGILQLGKKHVLDSRGEVPIKGKGLMHTYWLEGATENNEHSNEIAIHKTMMMVQEVLDASWRDQNRPNSMLSPRATATRGSSVDASALIDDATGTVNRGSISAHSAASEGTSGVSEVVAFGENLNTSQHSGTTRGSGIVARHSIKYNLLHRNNNGAVVPEIAFDSTGAKILVVEDSLAQRKMLLQSLHKADKSWDISYAVSGEEALQKLKAAKLQFDVIFVDENLSSNDGLFGHELVQVMRESFGMTTTVIVACTSNPQRVS